MSQDDENSMGEFILTYDLIMSRKLVINYYVTWRDFDLKFLFKLDSNSLESVLITIAVMSGGGATLIINLIYYYMRI